MTRLESAVLKALQTIFNTCHDMDINRKFEAVGMLVDIAKPQPYDRHQVLLRVFDMFPESTQVTRRLEDVMEALDGQP